MMTTEIKKKNLLKAAFLRNAIHDNAFHGIEVQLFVMGKVFCVH